MFAKIFGNSSNSTDMNSSLNGHIVHKLDAQQYFDSFGIPPKPSSELVNDLSKNGWCFIQFQQDDLVDFAKKLPKFFSLSPEEKRKHTGPYGFGYSAVDHKEGIRVLTGDRLQKDFYPHEYVPKSLQEVYTKASEALDTFALVLTDSLSDELFKMASSDLARDADIPVAYSYQRGFGMLDVAYYFNTTKAPSPQPNVGTSVADVNCVPHHDPGLLSISFFSDNEGLQLLDPTTNKWIDGPNNTIDSQKNIGVIWLGEAAVKATKGGVKAGVHRVVYPNNGKPRLTIWYEMCTVKQATEPEDKYLNTDTVIVPNLAKGAQQVEVAKGEKVVDILRKIERTRGIPMSKVFRLEDNFKGKP